MERIILGRIRARTAIVRKPASLEAGFSFAKQKSPANKRRQNAATLYYYKLPGSGRGLCPWGGRGVRPYTINL